MLSVPMVFIKAMRRLRKSVFVFELARQFFLARSDPFRLLGSSHVSSTSDLTGWLYGLTAQILGASALRIKARVWPIFAFADPRCAVDVRLGYCA